MTLRPGVTQDAAILHHETFPEAFVAGGTAGDIAATATQRMPNVPRDFKVDSVQYSLPSGFAANASAYWTIQLKNGSTVIASWSTQSTGSGGNGAITANTPVALVNNTTDANLFVAAGSSLTWVFTKTGAPANLPAGCMDIFGKFVS